MILGIFVILKTTHQPKPCNEYECNIHIFILFNLENNQFFPNSKYFVKKINVGQIFKL
jgi:hypothetical protein